jgi:pilus assembly protein CpaE
MNVSLFGPIDRQFEELLRSCGLRPTLSSLDNLAALGSPSASQPDVIMIDLRDRTTMPAAVSSIRQAHPKTGVILISSHLDPALMLVAMRAGVNEFLTEPVSQDDLKAALDRVMDARRPAAKSGQVFAFVGGKGGVGTTTLAVNVGTRLGTMARTSALLIDLHVTYGDAALFAGAEARFSVADALENVNRLDEAFLRSLVCHTKSGLDVLASSDRAMVGSTDTRSVRRLIDCAARCYQHVILDVPRSDATMLEGLDETAQIVIVANQELSTVRSVSRMAVALRQRYGKDRVAVVVTRYDDLADIGRDDIERVLGATVTHVFPSNYRLALDALNRGRPLVLDNHNKLASSFDTFARRLAGGSDARTSSPTSSAGMLKGLGLRR